jgi:hypothetical protein
MACGVPGLNCASGVERDWTRRTHAKVIEALADVMVRKAIPEHIRSDNGPEFVAVDLRKWHRLRAGPGSLRFDRS